MAEAETSSPTVYIVQERMKYDEELEKMVPMHDLSPAAAYGDIEVLIEERQIGINLQNLLRELREKLRGFSDDDYIVPTGDPVAMSMALYVAAEVNGKVTVLRWDRPTHRYIKVTVDFRRLST